MSEIKVIVPSHKRADIMTTEIENMILCVHKSEKSDYKNIECEKIYHDKKGLANIRQFLYEKFGDVFMVDDDIVSVERLFECENPYLDKMEIYKLIQETYYNAVNTGSYLFGFSNSMNPKHYKPQSPFLAAAYINACAFGIRESKYLYFSDKTTACESHWINLLNAYYHRYSFCDTRYGFRQKPNSTFILPGGQTSNRTMETEYRDTLVLKMMFGNSVKLKKGQKDSGLHHKYQRKLNIRL